jgi:hypothetical protein
MLILGVLSHPRIRFMSLPKPNGNRSGSATDLGSECSLQSTGFEDGAGFTGGFVEIVTQGDFGMMEGCHFHQSARDIDRVPDCRDVLVAVSAKA